MKSNLFSSLLLLIPILLHSQTSNDKIIYLDSLLDESTFENFKYLRVIKDYVQDKKNYPVIDYYDSGKVLMEGKTENKDDLVNTGQFIYYYENGNRQKIINFKKNKPIGSYFELYENGNKKLEAEYLEEKRDNPNFLKIKNYWDKDNNQKVIDGTGFYEENEKDFFTIGEVKNGFKEGVWEGSLKNQKITYKETYKSGKLISGESLDENKVTYNYTEIETKPDYKSGDMGFYKYVSKNYRTPKVQGLKGIVYVTFVVDKDGKIVEPKVLRDIGHGTGVEAIRVLNNCGEWTPGEQRGIKVRCAFSLPISVQSNR